LKINAIQLLFYQAPLSAIFLAMLTFISEPLTGKGCLFDTERNPDEWVFFYSHLVFILNKFLTFLLKLKLIIFSSGFLAFLVNLSTYWIIGAYSPLTYVILKKF
jgi:solute carrier family 35 protein E3